VARNRKRARGPRRPPDGAGVVTEDAGEVPEPLAHASPDRDLAEAQLALGRPEYAEVPDPEELEAFEEADQARAGGSAGGAGVDAGVGGDPGGSAPAELVPGAGGGAVAHRESPPARLVHFLQGSWRELQRVQWPDRRQVFQATGVVIGFVIVAGVFLGVSDLVASKIVNLILK
jgi:preprotein translocase subunit SecE